MAFVESGVRDVLQGVGPAKDGPTLESGMLPLSNRGSVEQGVKRDFEWEVRCDKLEVLVVGQFDSSVVDLIASNIGDKPDFRDARGKNRGTVQVQERTGWARLADEIPVRLVHRRFSTCVGSEVHLTFNPAVMRGWGLKLLGRACSVAGVNLTRGWVRRVDVAFDSVGVPRHLLRLDPAGYHLTLDGVTSRGPQTETIGRGWTSGFQAQLYDKSAERAAKGAADSVAPDTVRFELRRRGALPMATADGVVEQSEVRLCDLGAMAYPCPPGVCVRGFERMATEYGDMRYGLLQCAAQFYGTAYARRAAREVFAFYRPGLDVLDSCIWPEFEPKPAWAFDKKWPGVVADVLSGLCAAA